jgi:2-aminoethylphosphonate aminotransferase
MVKKIERKILLNPGPVTTTDTVKMAQVVPDICPREKEFCLIMSEVRNDLLKIINANPENYETVLFGGSGTSVMEATICSVIPANKSLLIIINGAYGERMKKIAETYSIPYDVLEYDSGEPINFIEVYNYLEVNPNIEYVAMVHHETTTGILNSIKNFSRIKKKYGKILILDAISSYAGIPIDLNDTPIDFLMSTSNKCIHGMPGLAFVICERIKLENLKDIQRRSFYLSLYDQYKSMETFGQMRFTPPVQVIYALKQAINEYFEEGGVNRYKRFKSNAILLREGLKNLGFQLLLNAKDESNILVTVLEPKHSKFNFNIMHDLLYERGITVYPGKIMQTNSFRLSNIGDLSKDDINFFLKTLKNVLRKMEVVL